MTRDRWIQIGALTLAIVATAGASLLVPTINTQRQELKLTFDDNIAARVPPEYALATAALGSFRGIAVDVLWHRAEMLKREGKHYEANSLAELITTLQPRFPQVWAFHAWNMAYNISVQTQTPEERWDWVQKGINLLRNEGIVYNPEAVRLYRELGWIFIHKIGQYTDDAHWYYKRKMAEQWEKLLGAPTDGASTEEAIDEFRPVADAADRYFRVNEPNREVRDALRSLIESLPAEAEELEPLLNESVTRIERQLTELRKRWQEAAPQRAERLRPVLEAARDQIAWATVDPVLLLRRDAPEAGAVIDAIREAGWELDEQALTRLGELIIVSRYADLTRLEQRMRESGQNRDAALARILIDPSQRSGLRAVLAFLRAKVLLENYHMDPVTMLELMEMFGPLDWRHPASHAGYWSYLGVEKSGQLRDRTKVDVLNTDRQVIHAMQHLMFGGRVNFDPLTGRIDLLPDPRFIPAYERAWDAAVDRQADVEWVGRGNQEAFDAGHENFLLKAIEFSYLYGEVEEARRYRDKAARLYGDKPHNQQSGRYRLPLEDLVISELRDGRSMADARAAIDGLLYQGFMQGLANARVDVFNRFSGLAKRVYDRYQESRDYTNPIGERSRLQLPASWQQTVTETFVGLMKQPGISLLERSRIYRNAPPQLQRWTFLRFYEPVAEQARQQNFDPQRMFPRPEGLEDVEPDPQIEVDRPGEEARETIERM